ncbi:hypothetical protein [Natronorarus salvus]|uniref:hypothetical protein n=1 Tax=Natronorarus salvus TaxID=3117733 RepID=UPI002F25FD10
MGSFDATHETERGFGLSGRDVRVVGGASVLLGINVSLMYVLVVTPLSAVNDSLFSVPIVGVVLYGVAITGGHVLAERGVKRGSTGVALVGVVLLQLAFGTFGAGVLSFVPREGQLPVLVVTALVVTTLTAVIGAYVYARPKTFEGWGAAATVAFVGGVVAIAIGSFVLPLLLVVGFGLVLLGFLLRLGWEIWRVRDHRKASVTLQTIGVYIAVAGIFVHVLQLVMRALSRR